MPIPVACRDRVDRGGARAVGGVGAAADERAGVGAAIADRAGCGRGSRTTPRSPCGWGSSISTVRKWRNRFAEHRLDGSDRRAAAGAAAQDHRREGRGGDRQDAGDRRRRTRRIGRRGRWPPRSGSTSPRCIGSGRRSGCSRTARRRWKLSKDPQFIDKVRDVVGLYLNPPERAVVLCVDEKSQIQALDRTAPILPMLPGVPERATHDYKRSGTSSLYAALDITTGKVIGACTAAIARSSSRSSCRPSTARSPPSSTCTSCSTTAPRTRRRRSRTG